MSYLLPYARYGVYLKSNENGIVKETYQQLFEQLIKGYSFNRTDIKHLKNRIREHVISPSQKVRKWACHCACFYSDDDIFNKIEKSLSQETEVETILWELTALSIKYDSEESLKRCVGKRHDEFCSIISKNYLTDALYYFGRSVAMNPDTILRNNNSSDLAALTKIYAYKPLTIDKYDNVTQDHITELMHHDDPYVREYAYWALLRRPSSLNVLDDIPDPVLTVRKHQIANQIQLGDREFIISALKPLSKCPDKIEYEIKIGILTGLKTVEYDIKYVPYICNWSTLESNYSVLVQIIDYMFVHVEENKEDGTYFDVLKDFLKDSDLSKFVVSMIKESNPCPLVLEEKNEKYLLDYKKEEEPKMYFKNEGIIGNNNSGNTLNNAKGGSTILNNLDRTSIGELDRLCQEVINKSEALSDEDKEKVNEAVDYVKSESQSEKPKKTVIKSVLDGLAAIKGTLDFGKALAELIKFFS